MILEGQEAVTALDAMTLQEGPCKGKSVLCGLRMAFLEACLETGIIAQDEADDLIAQWGY